MSAAFTSESEVKAVRKDHRCDVCRAIIHKGSPASRWAGMVDGDFYSLIYHTDCRAAEIEFNRIYSTWNDDWQPLADSIGAEDAGWVREKFPAVAERLSLEERFAP